MNGKTYTDRNAIVLGAGASRAVSYAQEKPVLSPLDVDFIDLLQRLEPPKKEDGYVEWVLQRCFERPQERLWESFERLFYTVHSRARTREWLFHGNSTFGPEAVEENFARAIQALLRAAHGTSSCTHHQRLLAPLTGRDTVVSFNYDLVPERAMGKVFKDKDFGPWLYGLERRHVSTEKNRVPLLLKLHGSVNWKKDGNGYRPLQAEWEEFYLQPSYGARGSQPENELAPSFPIMLPYWEKPVEHTEWQGIWREAARRLAGTRALLVWGYSLPKTDLQPRELFRLALTAQSRDGASDLAQGVDRLCVVDPSDQTAAQWREMFLQAKYYRFHRIEEVTDDFLKRFLA